jgi:hypothetical protein
MLKADQSNGSGIGARFLHQISGEPYEQVLGWWVSS